MTWRFYRSLKFLPEEVSSRKILPCLKYYCFKQLLLYILYRSILILGDATMDFPQKSVYTAYFIHIMNKILSDLKNSKYKISILKPPSDYTIVVVIDRGSILIIITIYLNNMLSIILIIIQRKHIASYFYNTCFYNQTNQVEKHQSVLSYIYIYKCEWVYMCMRVCVCYDWCEKYACSSVVTLFRFIVNNRWLF